MELALLYSQHLSPTGSALAAGQSLQQICWSINMSTECMPEYKMHLCPPCIFKETTFWNLDLNHNSGRFLITQSYLWASVRLLPSIGRIYDIDSVDIDWDTPCIWAFGGHPVFILFIFTTFVPIQHPPLVPEEPEVTFAPCLMWVRYINQHCKTRWNKMGTALSCWMLFHWSFTENQTHHSADGVKRFPKMFL